jgi:translocation and assembly module TamB
VDGKIDLSFLKRFDNDQLTLKLVANEAPGGLVASAASLPVDAAAMLDLDGRGTPAQWDGQLKLKVDGMMSARADLSANWLQGIGVNLTGTLTPGARLAQAPRLAIGKQADFSLLLLEDDSGIVRIKQGKLDARALQVAATGTFDRNASLLDLTVDVSVDRERAQRVSALTQPLVFEQASLRVTAKGAASALSSP